MRITELAVFLAYCAPGLDELAVAIELHHAIVARGAVSIDDKNIAIRRHENIRWSIELIKAVAGDAGLSEAHQQFAVGIEFMHLVAPIAFTACVRNPDIAARVDVDAVWPHKDAGAKTFEQFASGIEQEYVVQIIMTDAGILTAAFRDPDVAIRRCVDRARRAPFTADLSPAGRRFERIRGGEAGHACDQHPAASCNAIYFHFCLLNELSVGFE